MKYLIAALVGVILGAAGGLAALYYNPLTQPIAQPIAPAGFELGYSVPSRDVLVLTHGGRSSLPRYPSDAPELWESTINDLSLEVVRLKDENGAPTAFASRIGLPSEQTDLLLKGAIVTDYWLVTVAGQGSFFIHSESNLLPLLKEVVLPVRYLGQPWAGPADYAPTVGPALDKRALAYGATGQFAGLTGRSVETLRLEQFSATHGTQAFARRVNVAFAPPRPAEDTAAQAPENQSPPRR